MTRILTLLRTPGAMLAALLLALVAQLEHTAQVFSMVVGASGIASSVHAYAFAVAVETAVLLFVLAGHRWISYGFALATAATNLSYYAMHGINLFSIAALPAWLMSLLLPAAIVGYSHTIAENNPEAPANDDEVSSVATVENVGVQVATNVESGTSRPETPERPKTGKKRSAQKLSASQRRAQIASAGATDPAQVAAQFGVSVRTAQTDIASVRKGIVQVNGVHG